MIVIIISLAAPFALFFADKFVFIPSWKKKMNRRVDLMHEWYISNDTEF